MMYANTPGNRPQFLLPTFVITGFVAFGVTMYFGDAIVTGDAGSVRVVVTIFAILTGFILAIITIAGDPGRLYLGSWRVASAHRRQIKRSLLRYQLLFYVYLIVLAGAFATTIAQSVAPSGWVAHWLERFTMSACVAAFWWSLGLPTAHVRSQVDRLDQEVKRLEEQDREDAQKRLPPHNERGMALATATQESLLAR